MLEVNIKRYLKITHVFSRAVWPLLSEIFDLAVKGLSKVGLKKTVIAEKKAFKWEISIKMRN